MGCEASARGRGRSPQRVLSSPAPDPLYVCVRLCLSVYVKSGTGPGRTLDGLDSEEIVGKIVGRIELGPTLSSRPHRRKSRCGGENEI